MATSVTIPPSYGIATLRWTWIPAGKLFTVTIGYWEVGSVDTPQIAANTYRNAMIATGAPSQAALMTSDWRFEGVSVLQRLSTGVLQAAANLTPVTGTASSTAALSPVFTTLVVSKNTAYAGRAYRGRMYPPMTDIPENTVDWNGTIAAGTVTGMQTRWATFYGFSGLASYPPFLLHAGPPVGPAIPPTALTGLQVRPVVGIQRRRRARGA